jgi:hypothetical protein
MTVDLKGFAFNLGGVAVDGATAQVFTKNTSSQVGSNVTTGAGALLDGEFEFNGLAEGLYDVKKLLPCGSVAPMQLMLT